MESSYSKLGGLILQLQNRTNETKEAFDQALAELERQKVENEKLYKQQVEQLKEERRKWDEEKATMNKLAATASPIVNLNVDGEKMSTSRATLTLIDGSLLATMFSGKWEDKLMQDTNGCIFLDYDPVLFKYLLNQLRTWSDPSTKRIFRLPVGSEQSFLEFVRLLKFDERFIVLETRTVTSAAKVLEAEQRVEHFQMITDSSVQVTGDGSICEKIGRNDWRCIFGTLIYSIGVHRIRLRLDKGQSNILMGIYSQIKPPTGPSFYDKPTTHGWFTHGYVMKNGQGSQSAWPQVNENDILELTINCNERSLTILNERSRAQEQMQVNISEAPFPWCLLVLLERRNSRVSLV